MTPLLNLIILSMMCHVVHTHPFSGFSETSIITDKCLTKSLLSTTTRSRIDCGASCSADPECRRYVFCSSDSTCKLYQQGTDCIVDGYSSSCTCYRKNIGRNVNATITCPMGYYGDDCQTVVKGKPLMVNIVFFSILAGE
ncbi:hypothetical protein SNE40_020648 [Patella caerulea]|uniref:Apple domain-containing protein n=1 Tax=Patella caerulea TaxID=87958 RepID=A0AAN8J5C1_PATCE